VLAPDRRPARIVCPRSLVSDLRQPMPGIAPAPRTAYARIGCHTRRRGTAKDRRQSENRPGKPSRTILPTRSRFMQQGAAPCTWTVKCLLTGCILGVKGRHGGAIPIRWRVERSGADREQLAPNAGPLAIGGGADEPSASDDRVFTGGRPSPRASVVLPCLNGGGVEVGR